MAVANQQTRYRVQGMDCAGCASKIDTAVRRMPGVEDVNVSVSAATLTVRHAPESDLAAIERKVAGLGYALAEIGKTGLDAKPTPKASNDDHDHAGCGPNDAHRHDHDAEAQHLHGRDFSATSGPWWNSPKGRLTIASGVALAAAFAAHAVWPATGSWPFILAMLIGLVPIARRAVK